MIRTLYFQLYATLARQISSPFSILKFPLPDLGEKIKQGRVKKLYVKEGDQVTQFQKIADVESDKQFTQITAPEDGIIKRLYFREDQTCQVGEIFLDIQTKTEHKEETEPKKHLDPQISKVEPNKPHFDQSQDILASATVKMRAREYNINLKDIKGTGRKGRIFKEDLINYVQSQANSSVNASKSKQITGKIVPEENKKIVGSVKKVTMSDVQKQWQKLATYSTSIPHLYYTQQFDVTSLKQVIDNEKATNQKISLLSVLIKTFSLALKQHPKINSIYKPNNPFNIKIAQQQNLLLPMYSKNGLSLSIIDNLEHYSISKIQTKLNSTEELNLSPDKIGSLISKGTICLSNFGEIGGLTMNPPVLGEMTAHVSIGQVRSVPISTKGSQQRRQVVNVTIGGDHRVLDGGTVARFILTWKQLSEDLNKAFVNMI